MMGGAPGYVSTLRCVSAGRLTTGGPTLPLGVRCRPLLSGLSAICGLEATLIAEKKRRLSGFAWLSLRKTHKEGKKRKQIY